MWLSKLSLKYYVINEAKKKQTWESQKVKKKVSSPLISSRKNAKKKYLKAKINFYRVYPNVISKAFN